MPKQVLSTPSAPSALGPYSVAVETNGTVFFSGQIALDADGDPTGGTAEQAQQIMEQIAKESPEVFRQTVTTVATTLKFRPQYLWKQPIPKRVASVRRVLARPGSNPLAEELLAIYFLK